MNRIRFFILFFLAFPIILLGRTVYKGSVFFPDSLSYPYSITLYKDAAAIDILHFSSRNYSFTANNDVTSLKIYSLGFKPTDFHIEKSTADTIVLSPIYLEEKAQQLNEVVVTAKKAIVRNLGMNYTISNIRGSYIGNAGNLMDMLSWTPGVSVINNETISVLGRGGSPLIYVNGVRIMNQSELNALSSSNVDKIEIIREPGSEYPMGTSSVILITTVKPIGEMINGELTETAAFRRSFSDHFRATTFGRIKRLSFNASIAYNLIQNNQSSNSKYDIFSSYSDNDINQVIEQTSRIKNHSLNWFVGANYITKNKTTYLLQYSGSYGDNSSAINTLHTINRSHENSVTRYNTNSDAIPIKHSVLGYASFKILGGFLKFTGTFNHLTNHTKDLYTDEYFSPMSSSRYHYKYNMATFQGDYSHKLPGNGKYSYGLYLGYTDNFMHLSNPLTHKAQDVTGSSKWLEAYFSFTKKYRHLSFQGGLRGRYEFNTNTENTAKTKKLNYTNVAPKISINYSISEDYILSASYALSYGLPTFRQISPAIRLSNRIFYSQGNPSLKQSYTNRFNVTANLKDFTIISEYYDNHNSIFDITEPYVDGTFLRRPENMKRSSDFLLAAEYTYMPNSKLRIYSRVLGIRSELQYIYQSEPVKSVNYSMELDLNAGYKIGKFSIFINGRYNTPQKVDTRKLSYRLAINLGMDYSLLHNKFYVRLEAQDLFNRSVTPSWEEYSPLMYQYRRNRYDTRGLSLTFRYKFTSAKTGFRQATNAYDADRLD